MTLPQRQQRILRGFGDEPAAPQPAATLGSDDVLQLMEQAGLLTIDDNDDRLVSMTKAGIQQLRELNAQQTRNKADPADLIDVYNAETTGAQLTEAAAEPLINLKLIEASAADSTRFVATAIGRQLVEQMMSGQAAQIAAKQAVPPTQQWWPWPGTSGQVNPLTLKAPRPEYGHTAEVDFE